MVGATDTQMSAHPETCYKDSSLGGVKFILLLALCFSFRDPSHQKRSQLIFRSLTCLTFTVRNDARGPFTLFDC